MDRTSGAEGGPQKSTVPRPTMWAIRWFAAMLVVVYTAVGLYMALEWGGWQYPLRLVLFVPLLALFVGPMAAVAAALRWSLGRLGTPPVALTVVLSALTGPLVLFLFFATGDPEILVAPTATSMEIIFSPPMVLGGAVAAWLAELHVSARRPHWWLATLSAAVLGVMLLEPLSSVFARGS